MSHLSRNLHPHPPALQDKANLERQLKQQNMRSTMLEKNLERKDAQAEKKRESILVVANKTKDALSGAEERIKQLQFEQQRLQMDLTARTCEWRGKDTVQWPGSISSSAMTVPCGGSCQ